MKHVASDDHSKHLHLIARELLEGSDWTPGEPLSPFIEELKTRAARAGLNYNAAAVSVALLTAEHVRRKALKQSA